MTPKSIHWNATPNLNVGGGAVLRVLGHEGKSSQNGLVPSGGEDRGLALFPFTM